jgi:hypothetical protein
MTRHKTSISHQEPFRRAGRFLTEIGM